MTKADCISTTIIGWPGFTCLTLIFVTAVIAACFGAFTMAAVQINRKRETDK
jgi:hypothetical protein